MSETLDKTLGELGKRFGKGAVQKLGSNHKADIAVVSSGIMKLDQILGGGFPVGKIVELIGWEATGKTGLALMYAREVQATGRLVAIIDAEHALDKNYAEQIGVDVDQIYISQPDNGEEAFEIGRALAASGEFGLIIFDSVTAMKPKAEMEGETGESKMGLHARMMNQGLSQSKGIFSKNNCTAIFINQYREKLGVMYGDPRVGSGGNALKFFASVRVETSKGAPIKDGDATIGFVQKVKTIKHKFVAPFRTADWDILYGQGVDVFGSLVEQAVELGIIKKAGSWFSYDGTKLGQGLAKAKECINNNPELQEEIELKVDKQLNG